MQGRHVISCEGRAIPIDVRVSRRARRISIKVDSRTGDVELVLPPRTAVSRGLAFAQAEVRWVLRQLDALPDRVPFEDGAVVPYRGDPHEIRHHDRLRGGVWLESGFINVACGSAHLSRRVRDWFRNEARTETARLAHEKAAIVGKRVRRVAIRDQKTRWGSCSPSGDLSFNWRIVLAPPFALDYLVAHEVAHLREANHSRAFWAIVAELTPHMTDGRAWLRTHGNRLHRYG